MELSPDNRAYLCNLFGGEGNLKKKLQEFRDETARETFIAEKLSRSTREPVEPVREHVEPVRETIHEPIEEPVQEKALRIDHEQHAPGRDEDEVDWMAIKEALDLVVPGLSALQTPLGSMRLRAKTRVDAARMQYMEVTVLRLYQRSSTVRKWCSTMQWSMPIGLMHGLKRLLTRRVAGGLTETASLPLGRGKVCVHLPSPDPTEWDHTGLLLLLYLPKSSMEAAHPGNWHDTKTPIYPMVSSSRKISNSG